MCENNWIYFFGTAWSWFFCFPFFILFKLAVFFAIGSRSLFWSQCRANDTFPEWMLSELNFIFSLSPALGLWVRKTIFPVLLFMIDYAWYHFMLRSVSLKYFCIFFSALTWSSLNALSSFCVDKSINKIIPFVIYYMRAISKGKREREKKKNRVGD
mgnify:CR=1 FL=1